MPKQNMLGDSPANNMDAGTHGYSWTSLVALPGSLASSGAEQCRLGSHSVVDLVAMSPGQSLGSFQVNELDVPCLIPTEM